MNSTIKNPTIKLTRNGIRVAMLKTFENAICIPTIIQNFKMYTYTYIKGV